MKKILLVATAVLAFAMVVTGCGTTAEAAKTEPVLEEKKAPVVEADEGKVVDWQGKNIGMPQNPEWAQLAVSGHVGDVPEILAGNYVPYFDATSKHENLKVALNNAQLELASKFATQAISSVTVAAKNNLKSKGSSTKGVEEFSDRLVALASQAVFSGLKELEVHWVKEFYNDGRYEYNVYILAGMTLEDYKSNISTWLDNNAKPETAEEKAAVDEMKNALKASAEAAGFKGKWD